MQVAVVGGGVAGLSAAEALRREGAQVTLLEAKSRLGGRAGSFFDTASNRWLDLCQHIGMGCCSEWLDFCRRTEVMHHLRRDSVLHFLGPGGKRYRFAAASMLPPPLHLAPALAGMGFLNWRERLHLVTTLRALQSLETPDTPDSPSIGQWLAERGVSQHAIARFYEPVLISALGDSLERASLAMARKVFVDGFLTSPDGFHLLTPTCSLTEFYDQHVASTLERMGVHVQRSTAVKRISAGDSGRWRVELNGGTQEFGAIIAAVPWWRLPPMLDASLHARLPWLSGLQEIQAAPITGVHLWLDRPIIDLPHAAILDSLSQWIFAPPGGHTSADEQAGAYYHQVIISASQALRGRSEAQVIAEVLEDLRRVLPAAATAQLLRGRVVTEHSAVFSVQPGTSRWRPPQRTEIAGLYLAGDWTQTGWPATMESAVRSGQLAAQALLSKVR